MSKFVLTAQLQLQAPNNVGQVVQQIQNQLNGITVNVQAQGTAQAQKQVQQLTKSMTQATGAANNLGRTFALSVKRFTAFAVATRAVSLFTNTLSKSIEEAISFERQLIKISQVTGSSIRELDNLVSEVTRLSTSLGVSSKSLLNVSEILAQAGLSAKDTKVALDALAKSELAPTFENITSTAEGAVALLAQFKQGSAALESQLGSLNAVAGKFAVEAGDLIDVIRRTGGVFKASGGNLNELVALFTSVRATTRESAESIATGLRTIFTRIQRPKTIEFLKQFGVELTDLEGKFVGPYEAIKRLSDGLRGLAEGDITFIRIAEELGGFRQIGKVIPLLKEFKTAQEALNVAEKGSKGLANDAATAQLALAIRITKVKEEFLALVRGITDTKSFQIFANTSLNLASSLIKLADALKPLIPLLTAVATIKLAKGISSFIGGFKGGIGLNQGGIVHGFARGGLVPGSGNSDTVPAMLQPGEFVIRKSSVGRLGAGNLAAMNNNRHASGGKITTKDLLSKNIQGITTLRNNQQNTKYWTPEDKLYLANYSEQIVDPLATNVNKKLKIEYKKALSPQFRGGIFEKIVSTQSGRKLSIRPNAYLDLTNAEAKSDKSFKKGSDKSYYTVLVKAINQYASQLKNKFTPNIDNISPPGAFKLYLDKQVSNQTRAQRTNFAVGGNIGTDTVPALLTPGEFVVNKPSAQRIGYGTLNRMNKIGKYAKGGPVGLQRFFVGGVAEKDIVRAQGNVLQSIQQAESVFGSLLGEIAPDIKKAILDGWKGINELKGTDKFKTAEGFKSAENTRGIAYGSQSMSFQIKGKKAAATTETVAHEAGHIADFALGGKKQHASTQKGTFQFDLVEKVKPQMEAAFKDAGYSAKDIKKYLSSNKELFAEFFAKASPEVRAIITSTTDSAKGMAELKKHLDKAGHTYAGLEASDINIPKSSPTSSVATGGLGYPGSMAKSPAIINKPNPAAISGSGTDPELQKRIGTLSNVIKSRTSQLIGLKVEEVRLQSEIQKETNAITQLRAASSNGAKVSGELNAAHKRQSDLLKKQEAIINESLKVEGKLNNAKKTQSSLISKAKTQKQTSLQTQQMALKGGIPSTFAQSNAQANVIISSKKSLINPPSGSPPGGGPPGGGPPSGGPPGGGPPSGPSKKTTDDANKSMMSFGVGLTLVTSTLQSLLPPLDENSKAFTKISHSLLSMITTIGGVIFALESFGVTLKSKGIIDFLSGKGIGQRGMVGIRQGLTNIGLNKNISNNILGLIKPLSKLAGPIAAISGSAYLVSSIFNTLVTSMYDYDKELEKAIKIGSESRVQKIAQKKYELEASNTTRTVGATAGAGIGFIVGGPIGSAIGAAMGAGIATLFSNIIPKAWLEGINTLFGGQSLEQARSAALVQLQASKAAKALAEATDMGAKAMRDFEAGTISASDVLKSTAAANAEAFKLTQTTGKQIAANEKQKGGITRDIFTLGGLLGESSTQRNARIDKENAQLKEQGKQAQLEAFKVSLPGLEVLQKQIAAGGGSFEEFIKQVKAADPALAAFIQSEGAGALGLEKSFANLSKEAERTRKAFDAMNLGLQNVSASSAALGTNLDNYMASQQTGNIKTESTIRILEASITNAAQGISDADFSSALGDASAGLKRLGASESQVKKFEENLGAINTAQKFFASASQETKDRLKADFERGAAGAGSTEKRRDIFGKVIEKQLAGAGIGEDVRKRIGDALANSKLSETDMQKIMEGDFSTLDEVLKDLGQTTLKDVIPALQQKAKYEQVLVDLTKKRIDSENQVIAAQRGLLEAQLEAQDIISKYGGKILTPEMKKENILTQANVQRGELGISALTKGSAQELNRRNKQIRDRLNQISDVKQRAAAGDKGAQAELAGQSGVQLEAEQQRLLELAKSDYETTKKLIQLKEEELKLIGEKNKLEKDSISALISGDAEKFFELQQTKGAQAAIATGNVALQSAYGPAALGRAAEDIQRQQEAGVGELYGKQLAGAGGLTERAFGAALGARGITDARMAQVAAGTTMEEEMAKSDIRALAGTLPNSAKTQLMASEQDKQTADIQFKAAEIQLEAAVKQVEARAGGSEIAKVGASPMFPPTTGMSRGGVVYANRGIFVPRGTDTVPAMLTPGEFVVRREAVQRGNNLQLLRAINTGPNTTSMSASSSASTGEAVGMAKGGMVKYYANGDMAAGGLDISKLESVFTSFNNSFTEAINKLANTQLSIKLDATNINVNLTGGNFLQTLKKETVDAVLQQIGNKFNNMKVGPDGDIIFRESITRTA